MFTAHGIVTLCEWPSWSYIHRLREKFSPEDEFNTAQNV